MSYVDWKLRRHHRWLRSIGIDPDNPLGQALAGYMKKAKDMVPVCAPDPYHLTIDSYIMVKFKETMEEEGYYVAGPFPILVPTIYRYEVSRAQ